MSGTGNPGVTVTKISPVIVEEPVFIVGAERSGTTLLLLLLGHHPELCITGEFDFAIQYMPLGSPPRLEDYYKDLEADRIFQHHQLKIDQELDFEKLVNSFLIQQREPTGKPRVGASIHFNYANILSVWPKAKLIHLVRDPRDVASSCIQRGWAGNVWCGIEKWIASESEWDEIVSSIPADQLFEVRFEDLVENTQAVLSDICEFIDLEYSEKMLSFHKYTTYDPINPKIAQKWPGKLSDREVRLIESKVGVLLEQKGYEPSGKPTLQVGPLSAWGLRAQSAYLTRMFRIKKYGLRLWMRRALGRFFGMKSWSEKSALEFGKIKEQHLK